MFNPNLLRGKIVEKGSSVSKLCSVVGISEPTYYRKLSRNGDFSREEIFKISEELGLSDLEKNEIFFV